MSQVINSVLTGLNDMRHIVSRAMPRSAKLAVGLAAVVIVGAILVPVADAENKVEEAGKKRVDLYGDSLPAGAVARLGTHRLRHQSQVVSVAFSADGKTIASAGADKAVMVWEGATGKIRHRLLGHTRHIYTMAISRDGKMLASGSRNNGQVILWDAVAGKQLRELGCKGSVYWVAFSPDGKVAATVSHQGIHLWDVKTGWEKRCIEEPGIYWAGFGADGKTILSASGRGKEVSWVRLWDAVTGKEIRSFEGTKIYSVTLSPDGEALAAGKKDGSIRVWSVETGQTMAEFPLRGSGFGWNACIIFSPDGKLLASVGDSSQTGQIRILSLKTGKEVKSCKGHHSGGLCVAFSPDGKIVASGGRRRRVLLWDVETGGEAVRATSHFGAVRSVAFLPEGRFAITKSVDETIRFWDAATSVQRYLVRSYWRWAVSPDGRLIASVGNDSSIRLRDIRTGQTVHILVGHSRFVDHFAFTGDGKRLASLDRRGDLRLWDVTSGEQIIEFDSKVNGVIVFSGDGKILASGGKTGEIRFVPGGVSQGKNFPIRLWDAGTGKEIAKLGTGEDPVSSLAFSGDGRLLASGHGVLEEVRGTGPGDSVVPPTSSDTVCLWDLKTHKQARSLKGHTDAVSSVAFSTDSAVAASAGMDGTVRLWEVSSGKEIAKLAGHGLRTLDGIEYAEVYSVAFSPDGRLLASASKDGTVLLWDIEAITKSRLSKTGAGGGAK